MSEQNSTELKPCPFCGSIEIERKGWGYYASERLYFRRCFDCRAETDKLESPEAADKRWNTRPGEDSLRAENESLKDILAFFEIEIQPDGKPKFKKSALDRHFKAQKDDELLKLRGELERVQELETLFAEIQSLGYWLELKSPFRPGKDLWFAGLTPQGVTGWNGRPDFKASGRTAVEAVRAVIETLKAQPGEGEGDGKRD